MGRWIFSEFVEYEALMGEGVLEVLSRRGVGLVWAVQGEAKRAECGRVFEACRKAGVRVTLWPMLGDDEGRWVSATNVERFVDEVSSLFAMLEGSGSLPDELLLDLEPPIDWMRGALRGGWSRLSGAPGAETRARLRGLVDKARGLGVESWATAPPPVVVSEDERARRGWAAMLGTPVEGLGLVGVCPMAYTSLIEGYGRGVMRRRDALGLLATWSRSLVTRGGGSWRPMVGVGAVGVGALGDEACYRGVEELREDVAQVRAVGIEDIALFCLGGAMRRGLEAWLDALEAPASSRVAPLTMRGRALKGASRLAGRLGVWSEPRQGSVGVSEDEGVQPGIEGGDL